MWLKLTLVILLLLVCQPQSTVAAMSQDEQTALELLNKDRIQAGVPSLLPDEKLADLARLHAQDMLDNAYFSHVDLKGRDPFRRMKDGGVSFLAAGENIYKGFDDPPGEELEIAERFLMQSPGHRGNILERDFTRAGIGVARSNDGWLYLVQCFIR